MNSKKHLFIIGLIIGLLFIVQIHFMGCAGTQAGNKGQTSERQKAIQDSLAQEQLKKVHLYYSFGHEPYKKGDWLKAKRYFLQVSRMDTSEYYGKLLYKQLGHVFTQLNQPDSAEWAYRHHILKNPQDAYSYKALGHIYKIQSRNEEAVELYKTLTEIEPDSSEHYYMLGELYAILDEKPLAIKALDKCIALDPNNRKAREILTPLLSEDPDKLIESLLSTVERFPSDMEARFKLAQSYMSIGRFEPAVDQLKILIEKQPDNILAMEMLGEAYSQLEEHGNAANIYRRILQLRPDDKKNLCALSMSYTSLGQYTAARTQAEKAMRIDPNFGLVYISFGFIYETCANRCIDKRNGKITFDDKLVYKRASDEYEKAKRDTQFRSDASSRVRYLEISVPTREDYFMNRNKKVAEGSCYEWIRW